MTEYEDLLQFCYLAPVGLVRTDAEGTVVSVNPEAMRLLGPLMTADPTRLLPVLDRLAPEARRVIEDSERTGRLGRYVARAGEDPDIWVELEVVRVSGDQLMVVLVDRTEEHRLRAHEAQQALSVNDGIVQQLVIAETHLELGDVDAAREHLGRATRAARTWVGAQLAAAAGDGAHLLRGGRAAGAEEEEP